MIKSLPDMEVRKALFTLLFSLSFLSLFAQALEGQSPEEQLQAVIQDIRLALSDSHPFLRETNQWALSISEEDRDRQGVHASIVQEIDEIGNYLWFSNNSEVIKASILKNFSGPFFDDFGFDFYQIGMVSSGPHLALVVFLDYQNPVLKLEDLQRLSLEGTGLSVSDMDRLGAH